MVAHSGLITVMQRAARKAAPRLRRDFGEVEQLQVSRKGPADFVSMADKRAEATIVAPQLGHRVGGVPFDERRLPPGTPLGRDHWTLRFAQAALFPCSQAMLYSDSISPSRALMRPVSIS